mgnify:FL=1
MNSTIEERLTRLENMLKVPERYQEWAEIGVLQRILDDIKTLEKQVNEALNLAEEAGIIAIKSQKQADTAAYHAGDNEEYLIQLEKRLEALEDNNDR